MANGNGPSITARVVAIILGLFVIAIAWWVFKVVLHIVAFSIAFVVLVALGLILFFKFARRT